MSRLAAIVARRVDGSKLMLFLRPERFRFHLIVLPMINPDKEAFVLIVHGTVYAPVEAFEPLQLHNVELADGDAAYFSPGSVLESVVIKKFAAEQQTRSEHTIDCARRGRVIATLGDELHSRRQIEQSQHDGRARETSRRENLGDVFAELLRGFVALGYTSGNVNICKAEVGGECCIHALGHLRHKCGHHIHVVVQVSCHASSGFLFLLLRLGVSMGKLCCELVLILHSNRRQDWSRDGWKVIMVR